MTTDTRDLLEVLKTELDFLAKGGYRRTTPAYWRPLFIFQDSPTCPNFDPAQPPMPCADCVLMQLIPENLQNTKIPCRSIPLNSLGETIDSFYRTGTPNELENAMARWLKMTIVRLEQEKSESLIRSNGPLGSRTGEFATDH
jgi:hypothetical protein